ncbi:uncharacterized protein CEXT_497671 [Caerostris extrusa]|uniref:Uncharacterized protein n=1 Tax=Caerostris extrusa TaxID=172846 RepID=A0AAV4XTL0_CAEEX|nr:uncharacterized protein CEXT_497671 [Caerostris extrusa]
MADAPFSQLWSVAIKRPIASEVGNTFIKTFALPARPPFAMKSVIILSLCVFLASAETQKQPIKAKSSGDLDTQEASGYGKADEQQQNGLYRKGIEPSSGYQSAGYGGYDNRGPLLPSAHGKSPREPSPIQALETLEKDTIKSFRNNFAFLMLNGWAFYCYSGGSDPYAKPASGYAPPPSSYSNPSDGYSKPVSGYGSGYSGPSSSLSGGYSKPISGYRSSSKYGDDKPTLTGGFRYSKPSSHGSSSYDSGRNYGSYSSSSLGGHAPSGYSKPQSNSYGAYNSGSGYSAPSYGSHSAPPPASGYSAPSYGSHSAPPASNGYSAPSYGSHSAPPASSGYSAPSYGSHSAAPASGGYSAPSYGSHAAPAPLPASGGYSAPSYGSHSAPAPPPPSSGGYAAPHSSYAPASSSGYVPPSHSGYAPSSRGYSSSSQTGYASSSHGGYAPSARGGYGSSVSYSAPSSHSPKAPSDILQHLLMTQKLQEVHMLQNHTANMLLHQLLVMAPEVITYILNQLLVVDMDLLSLHMEQMLDYQALTNQVPMVHPVVMDLMLVMPMEKYTALFPKRNTAKPLKRMEVLQDSLEDMGIAFMGGGLARKALHADHGLYGGASYGRSYDIAQGDKPQSYSEDQSIYGGYGHLY